MKRDFDLIRKVLLIAEENNSPEVIQLPYLMEKLPGFEAQLLGYNIDLMAKAGLIEGEVYGFPIQGAAISNLTWAGHDFLDAARSETVWNAAKKALVAVGGSASLEVLKALLVQTTKQLLNLPP